LSWWRGLLFLVAEIYREVNLPINFFIPREIKLAATENRIYSPALILLVFVGNSMCNWQGFNPIKIR
jgi:hypothetical protein